MKRYLFVMMLVMSVLLSGCAMKDEMDSPLMDEGWEDFEDEVPDYDKDFEPSNEAGGEVLASNDIPALETRKIIYTANLAMVATDPEAIYQSIVGKLVEYDAYFEAEDINAEIYDITIRVLSENLMEFVNDIKGQGEVINYSKSSQDITNQYSRFEAEYTALQTEYDRIFALLESATQLSDIYSLSNKLAELETDLNQIGLQLSTYDSLVDYSTINLLITKIDNIESLMDTSGKAGLYYEDDTEDSITIRVRNNSSFTSSFYIVVKQNGEEITTITKTFISEAEETLVFDDLDSDTEYKFEVYSTEDNHLTSAPSVVNITTEKTYGSVLASAFTGSVNSIITIFQWLVIIVLAIIPYGVVLSIIGVPSFIVYKKYKKAV